MAGIWALPGPARFARAVRTLLDRGYSVFIGLPVQVIDDSAFCSGLLASVDYAVDLVDCHESGSRPLSSLVADRFSIDDIPPGPDAAAALGRHSTLWGRVLAIMVPVDDVESARWAHFAREFVAGARAVAVAERPRLILLCGKTCAAELAGSEPLLSGLWWWGVLDRLDTGFHVRSQFPDGCEELLREAVTEVAGFDLKLAGHLAAGWDGSDSALAEALVRFPGRNELAVCTPHGPLPSSSTALSAPPTSLLQLWDQGLVDRWDAFPAYLHACAVPATDLKSRVWRAQIRALMPSIDEERARIGAWLRRELPGIPGDAVLEPGDLYVLLQDHPHLKSWRGGHRKRLIYWLREARNTLAHMGTLTPGEISRGRRLVVEDHRHE